jgi:ankyrin repeat protein
MSRIFLRFAEPLLVIAMLAALVYGARGWRWAAGWPPVDECLIAAAGDDNGERAFDDALAAGASPRAHGALGTTALIVASSRGNLGQVRQLLARGAEVNATDRWGGSALLWAAQLDQAEIVQFLLDHGADPALRNQSGQTALDIAISREASAAEAVLRNHSAKRDPLHPQRDRHGPGPSNGPASS